MALNTVLPHVLAGINLATVLCLSGGWLCIRRKARRAHRAFMLVATVLGVAFLALYLSYHFAAGLAKFGGSGMIRPIYFTLLVVHIGAAAVAAMVVPIAVLRAWREQFEVHRPIARFAMPLWLFVSVSGFVVYVMTIHLYPFVEEAI